MTRCHPLPPPRRPHASPPPDARGGPRADSRRAAARRLRQAEGRDRPDDDGRDRAAADQPTISTRRSPTGRSATRPARRTATSGSTTPRRCAGPGATTRRWRCCRRRSSTSPTTAKCWPPTARRWPRAATSTRALATIERAQTPDQPDWRLISAKAAILDQVGRNDEARKLYAQALDLAPNEPTRAFQLRHVVRADRRPGAGGEAAPPRDRAARRRQPRAPEPGAGGGAPGPLRRGAEDRLGGDLARAGGGQRRLPEDDAGGPAEHLAAAEAANG